MAGKRSIAGIKSRLPKQEEYKMIKEAIQKIVRKGDLSYKEAYDVMNEIMNGETTATQNAAFLAALSTKSTKAETIDEISGCAAAMREHATPVPHPGMEVLEIVGTGGDKSNSFNISTTAAFVVAAGGRNGREGGQARQPGRFFQVRHRRCAGSAGR
jgi:anthranilate phosphoribosyltransferase